MLVFARGDELGADVGGVGRVGLDKGGVRWAGTDHTHSEAVGILLEIGGYDVVAFPLGALLADLEGFEPGEDFGTGAERKLRDGNIVAGEVGGGRAGLHHALAFWARRRAGAARGAASCVLELAVRARRASVAVAGLYLHRPARALDAPAFRHGGDT